jgi:hypothetical protein
MVKTIRVENENIHKKLVKIQGRFMAEDGDSCKLEEVLEEIINFYNEKNPKRRSK